MTSRATIVPKPEASRVTPTSNLVRIATSTVAGNMGHLGKVLQNRGFTYLLILFSLGVISSLAFIASSTYIYQDGFHLSSQMYSFYFSLNALGMIAGPMIYLWLSRRFHSESIIWTCFATVAVSGVLVCIFGNLQPWIFALCILPATIAGSCIRPPSTNMMAREKMRRE